MPEDKVSYDEFTSKYKFGLANTLGIEQEFFFVDRYGSLVDWTYAFLQQLAGQMELPLNWINGSRVITPMGEQILDRIKTEYHIQPELPAQQVEITTKVCMGADELVEDLNQRRSWLQDRAKQQGLRLSYASCPVVTARQVKIFPRRRYLDIHKNIGKAISNGFISSTHFHVGLKDKEQAITALNRVNQELFTLFDDVMSDRRMARYQRVAGPDRMYAPGVISSWEHYYEIMAKQDNLEDPTFCWWLARLHPQGTLEVRAPDVIEDLNIIKDKAEKLLSIVC